MPLAACGHALEGSLSFSPSYITAMVRYFPSAFTQQFYLCSVGLVSLAKLPVFRGPWRLPLLLSLIFGVAHYFGPALMMPGTAIPLHIIGTMPLGFVAAYYFLRFRNVMPLSICHAVFYVLMNRWIERSLT